MLAGRLRWKIILTQYYRPKIGEKKNGDQEDRYRSSDICLIGIPEETEN